MKWGAVARFLVKWVPTLIEAILAEKVKNKDTVTTTDGRTVHVVEWKE
jgi:hypothetical protein